MRGSSAQSVCVAEDDVVETVYEKPSSRRLRGHVEMVVPDKRYGFITVAGTKDPATGHRKQWHFHLKNSLKQGVSPRSIARGVVVEFTPVACPVKGKCDKATEIEVVG